MYEISDKKLRDEFKKTEYGRKTNIWLYFTLPLGVIALVFLILTSFGVVTFTQEQLDIIYPLGIVFVSLSCYFDGKRDGAFEQFRRSKKK